MNSRLGHPKSRRGLTTMHGGIVVTPTLDAMAFHDIGSISPSSVFGTASFSTTTHGTRLQSMVEQASIANTELDAVVAMAARPVR
jgi:hypothetical protein